VLRVEKLGLDQGEKINFEEVLMVSDGETHQIGTPLVKGASVAAEVMSNGRAKKVKIMKFKRRKHHMKQMGHRQSYTEIKIKSLKA
jgi:large subunit ribosomal protein L21